MGGGIGGWEGLWSGVMMENVEGGERREKEGGREKERGVVRGKEGWEKFEKGRVAASVIER